MLSFKQLMHASGAADCSLETSHVARNRHAYHSHACELHILMHQAYQSYLQSLDEHITTVRQEQKGENNYVKLCFYDNCHEWQWSVHYL